MPNEAMDLAAAKTEAEWHDLPDPLTKEQLRQWIEDNYRPAGYKRICKIVMGESYTTELD